MGVIEDFRDSATKLFIEEGASDEEQQQYLQVVMKDRGEKYIEKLQRKYPPSLIEKVQEYYEGLSPTEKGEYAEHFERVIPAALEAYAEGSFVPSEPFTAKELSSLHNRDGSLKSLTPGVFDAPLRDYDREKWKSGEGVLVEAPVQTTAKEITVPTPEEARSMDLLKLRRFIPTQRGVEEDE